MAEGETPVTPAPAPVTPTPATALASAADAVDHDGAIKTATDAVAAAKTPEEKAAAETALKTANDAKAKAGDDGKPKGPPEKYDFKLPEGFELNKDLVDQATPLFKEIGLTNDQAQKLVDFHAGFVKQGHEALAKAWDDVKGGWLAESKADKDIGGANFDKNVGVAVSAIKALDIPGLGEALNSTGAGNHPAFIKAFHKIGTLMAEGKVIIGGTKPPAENPLAKLYTTMNPANG